jgi:hypothetical protein
LEGKGEKALRQHDRQETVKTFMAMLDFLYSGDSDSIINPDNVVDLLGLADRMMIEPLKQRCENLIEQSLDWETACSLLDLGDRYNAPRLKRAAEETICKSRWQLEKIAALPEGKGGLKDLHGAWGSLHLIRELDFLCNKLGLSEAGEVVKWSRM